MTRRELLALLAVGPFARRLPTPTPTPPTPLPVYGESPIESVYRTMARIEMIEVTAFGDDNEFYLPLPRPR